jgi:hypothetical protein
MGGMEKLLLSRRQTLALGAASLFSTRTVFAAPTNPVLIELFTSQGCSSCPPADVLAGELARDPNNIVLSFNVDYWDYLGWRDTLAKAEYSQRQYDYAKSRGDGSVYTPQMVVNGATHVVGSNRRDVKRSIASGGTQPLNANIELKLKSKSISVEISKTDFAGEATLWLMAVESQVKQKIERGENSGKDIVYVNVVRNLVPAAMWSGEAFKGSWMRDAVMTKSSTQLVAVLQQNKVGKVMGLARA